jgi:hypothetical protein
MPLEEAMPIGPVPRRIWLRCQVNPLFDVAIMVPALPD